MEKSTNPEQNHLDNLFAPSPGEMNHEDNDIEERQIFSKVCTLFLVFLLIVIIRYILKTVIYTVTVIGTNLGHVGMPRMPGLWLGDVLCF